MAGVEGYSPKQAEPASMWEEPRSVTMTVLEDGKTEDQSATQKSQNIEFDEAPVVKINSEQERELKITELH